MTIIASADGSALGNPGPAGWAWYIDPTSWRAGGWPRGTNNMGELTAVLNLLESTRHRADEPLTVYCDSQYVINSVTKWMPGWKKKGWKKRDGKPVLNVDIMKALDRELSGRTVTFEWVKGHAGHELNEAADERARAMATAYQRKTAPRDMPVGPGFRDDEGLAGPPDGSAASPVTDGAPDEVPDLFSELESSRVDPVVAGARGAAGPQTGGAEQLPPHLLSEVGDREAAVLRGPGDPHAAALLHPDLAWVDERGRTGAAADFVGTEDPGGAFQEMQVTAVGAASYHLSYRLQGPSTVTRRSSVWVREDQHNEMGPWLLRFHQVTAEG